MRFLTVDLLLGSIRGDLKEFQVFPDECQRWKTRGWEAGRGWQAMRQRRS
jgi:hypothetical protein